jgi:homoserine kinase type II
MTDTLSASMDLEQLPAAWPIERPFRLRATIRGISRSTNFVDTPSASYLLCVYPPGTDATRVRYEHALLGALRGAGLPFAVPSPVPTEAGATFVEVSGGDRLASLVEVIPGQMLDGTSPVQTRAFGLALGHLHRALATVDLGPAPPRHLSYGAIERFLTGVEEPLGALDGVPLTEDDQRRVRTILDALGAEAPTVVAALPHQLRHGDWNGSNALLVDDRVRGVLDFEFARPDVRAMDLAHGWYYLSVGSPDDPWAQITAFAAGYREVVAPTAAEVAAVPLLTKLYFGASTPFAIGRWRRGEADVERVRTRVRYLLELDEFLRQHAGRLVDTLTG